MSKQAQGNEVTCPGPSQEDVKLRSRGHCPVRRTTCRSSSSCLLFGVFVGRKSQCTGLRPMTSLTLVSAAPRSCEKVSFLAME